ncbi:unnamed protein product, partial [Allacma fusca]
GLLHISSVVVVDSVGVLVAGVSLQIILLVTIDTLLSNMLTIPKSQFSHYNKK